jgi:hypothetical protein
MCGLTARHTLQRCQKRAEAVEMAEHRAYSTTQHDQITALRQETLNIKKRPMYQVAEWRVKKWIIYSLRLLQTTTDGCVFRWSGVPTYDVEVYSCN